MEKSNARTLYIFYEKYIEEKGLSTNRFYVNALLFYVKQLLIVLLTPIFLPLNYEPSMSSKRE